MRLSQCTLEVLLPHLLISSSNATIEKHDKMWVATSMLIRFLNSFTNSLVVLEKEFPVGVLGGTELLREFSKNPTFDFFNQTSVSDVMNKELYSVTRNTKLFDLLKQMKISGRDFALIQNEVGSFSTISTRRLLEIGILCNTNRKVSEIQQKKIITFTKQDKIGYVISEMIKNHVDVLVLNDTPLFITSKIILEKIQNELSYLHNVDNFLDYKMDHFKLDNAKIISSNVTIPEMCKVMLNMKQPFIMTRNQVLTPCDLITALR